MATLCLSLFSCPGQLDCNGLVNYCMDYRKTSDGGVAIGGGGGV